ncbi:antibiotic acetyltransferase [Enterococcus sp. 669A]|uniref:Antibiotic acetyltransferase n=2 Tax=Candidatus Enterococcus moelleringii TaxID=2815325 RepID=A0ABS3L9X5_9ENTE|nr:antibiotic acetyltransferase [Enterococcus sp. 669A]
MFSDGLDRLLVERDIFTKLTTRKNRFVPEKDLLFILSTAEIEPFTIFVRGNHFHTMGAFSYSRSNLPVDTIVGRYSSIAPGVRRMGPNHPMDRFTTSQVTYETKNISLNTYKEKWHDQFETAANQLKCQPIVIGNDVWIGENVTFSSKGITVHDGAVIAANSIVTKDVPPYAVVAGCPAQILNFRFSPECIHQLLELKWWEYDFGQFSTIRGDEPIEAFIEKIDYLMNDQQLEPFHPKATTIQDFLDASESR